MFGFLKTNHEARRDEVQAEFVARVAAAAQDSSRPPARRRRAGLHAGQHPCAGCRARGRSRRRAGPDADADRGRGRLPVRGGGASTAGCTKSATTRTRWCWSAASPAPRSAWPPLPRSSAASVTAGRGDPALLRTLHRGAACRRDPDPALDPRFPGARLAAPAGPAGHMRNTRRPRAPRADCLGTERKAPYSAIPAPRRLRAASPGGLFTAVHSRPLYASVCLAPGAPA